MGRVNEVDFVAEEGIDNFKITAINARTKIGSEVFRKRDFVENFGTSFEFAIIKFSVGILNRQLTKTETELMRLAIKSVIDNV